MLSFAEKLFQSIKKKHSAEKNWGNRNELWLLYVKRVCKHADTNQKWWWKTTKSIQFRHIRPVKIKWVKMFSVELWIDKQVKKMPAKWKQIEDLDKEEKNLVFVSQMAI